MKMEDLARPEAPGASPEVFQKLGSITRELHDTLNTLGVMPTLQHTAESLPDARSRLSYIARKTGEAADKVLTAVEHAKHEHANIQAAVGKISATLAASSLAAVACAPDDERIQQPALVMEHVAALERAADRIDGHLTEIMLAQDFHDLTGQVVSRVVSLAINLEESLVKLLVKASGDSPIKPVDEGLQGPVVEAGAREDVVTNQGEVDDLLASLGF